MCRECSDDPRLAWECRHGRAESLGRIYLFEGLGAVELDEVLDLGTEIELAEEQWLLFRGDPAQAFYLVLEGEVALLHHSLDGDEFIVAFVGPGELFGEDLLCLDEAAHPVSARALQSSRLVAFDRSRMRERLESDPAMQRRLLQMLQRRNSILLEEIERVTVLDASQRLVTFLEAQATRGKPVPLRLSKRLLAAKLSIRPETLSRVLKRLKSCHRIQEADGHLVVLPQPATDGDPCELCPARLWGCPGPGAFLPRTAMVASADAEREATPQRRTRTRLSSQSRDTDRPETPIAVEG